MSRMMNPQGTRDLNRKTSRKKSRIINKIEDKMSSWGYAEVRTPVLEYLETFERGLGCGAVEDSFKLISPEGEVLALRRDVTIPIARMVSTMYQDVEGPIRFRYNQEVFNMKEAHSGNFIEITDIGCEMVGRGTMDEDVEIITMAFDALDFVADQGLVMVLGDIRFLRGLCHYLDLEVEEFEEMASLIDDKNLPKLESYLGSLGFSKYAKEFFLELPWAYGGLEVIDQMRKYAFTQEMEESLDQLEELYQRLSSLGFKDKIKVDFSRVSTLNYYTSTIFEGFLDGIGQAVVSGGRYDNLLAKFQEESRPAMGFAIKVDRLLDLDILPGESDYFIVQYPKGKFEEAYRMAQKERDRSRIVLEEADVEEVTMIKGDMDA